MNSLLKYLSHLVPEFRTTPIVACRSTAIVAAVIYQNGFFKCIGKDPVFVYDHLGKNRQDEPALLRDTRPTAQFRKLLRAGHPDRGTFTKGLAGKPPRKAIGDVVILVNDKLPGFAKGCSFLRLAEAKHQSVRLHAT